MYLFCPKLSKNDSRKAFVKKLLDSILYVLPFSVHLCVYTLNVLTLWKINFYMFVFDWFRINNKYDFRLANRFTQCKFFKFFIAKRIKLEPMNLPRFPSFSLPNPFKCQSSGRSNGIFALFVLVFEVGLRSFQYYLAVSRI